MPEMESFDDGAFVVHETRFGTYRAVDRQWRRALFRERHEKTLYSGHENI